MSRIVYAMFDVDMRCGHPKLIEMAQEKRVDPLKLKAGDCVVFVNHRKTAAKIVTGSGTVVIHYRPGREITLQDIYRIPESVGGRKFSLSEGVLSGFDRLFGSVKRAA